MSKRIIFICFMLAISVVTVFVSACSAAAPSTAPSTSAAPSTASAAAAGQAKILRLAFFNSNTVDSGLIVQKNADAFNAKIKNYQLKTYPMETLVKMFESMDAVRTGTTELCVFPLGPFVSAEQKFASSEIPFLYNNIAAEFYGVQRLIPEYSGVLEQRFNQKVLGIWTSATLELACAKKQIKTLDDFKGLLMMNISPQIAGLINALGASAVTIPPMEAYASLQKKTIEATLQALGNQYQNKLYEVAPYVTVAAFSPTGIVMTVNQNTWNSLPKDVQDALTAMGNDDTNQIRDWYIPAFDEQKARLTKNGATVYDLPKAERDRMVAATKPFANELLGKMGDFGVKVQQVADEANKQFPYKY